MVNLLLQAETKPWAWPWHGAKLAFHMPSACTWRSRGFKRHLEQLRQLRNLLVRGCLDLLTLPVELTDTLLHCFKFSCGRLVLSLELCVRGCVLRRLSLRTHPRGSVHP